MVLELKNINKNFGIVKALKNVSLFVEQGKTLALMGENGAGKSTLMKIVTGAYKKDSGEIFFGGKEVKLNTPNDAMAAGISQVYQRAEIVPNLTVAENIFIGENGFSKKGVVLPSRLYAQAQELLDQCQIPINAKVKMKNLSVAACHLVSFVKVLQRNPKLIIFDEPTAVLSDKEVDILFRLIKQLQDQECTIIYISHRMEEIFKISHNIAVMRDGEMVKTLPNKGVTKEDVVSLMLGRSLGTMFPKKQLGEQEDSVLAVSNITNENVYDISFNINKGEILGIAGLVGSGRTELARAIYGVDKTASGEVFFEGEKLKNITPQKMVAKGIFLAPEDRKGLGLVLSRSIKENITYSNLAQFFKKGLLRNKKEQSHTNDLKDKINIKAPTINTLSANLSGGNQQKVVVAKALTANPKVLIADEPTQGIDVGAKAEIYSILTDLAKKGMAIIVISSEIEEIMNLCHRVIVMRTGKIVGEVQKENINNGELILGLMYSGD